MLLLANGSTSELPEEETQFLWKPEHSWETLQIKRNSNICVQQGKDKVFQLEYDRIYYPTHKAPSEFFPTMGSVYA